MKRTFTAPKTRAMRLTAWNRKVYYALTWLLPGSLVYAVLLRQIL